MICHTLDAALQVLPHGRRPTATPPLQGGVWRGEATPRPPHRHTLPHLTFPRWGSNTRLQTGPVRKSPVLDRMVKILGLATVGRGDPRWKCGRDRYARRIGTTLAARPSTRTVTCSAHLLRASRFSFAYADRLYTPATPAFAPLTWFSTASTT